MKHRKVHPSPSSTPADPSLSVLSLLPAAILALTAALGVDDREVLAYLITQSLNLPSPPSEEKRRCNKKPSAAASAAASGGGGLHRAAFDCGCFGCYMSYWCRWDSSPDRELIHRVIEAFEEHLESSSSKKAVKSRKKDRRSIEKSGEKSKGPKEAKQRVAAEDEQIGDESPVDGAGEGHCDDVRTVSAEEDNCDDREVTGNRLEVVEAPQQQRKAWPDVMGLFNSRLWGLWSPAV
ncbi:hypothetical protein QJS10_CPA16g00957 [Acorus calamus]|uniref:Uncharacterized protein n=1 Tax=Acorus calamus TaxID=4465 RepID=A0AAV9D3G1_ACOCL|nr:hypothetical protein QJS10_CPA16g00957 [Acorus calamus]